MSETHEINWERAAYDLWRMLDDIDTLDDACREDDAGFRKLAYAKQRKRFEIIGEPAITLLYDKFYRPTPPTKGAKP